MSLSLKNYTSNPENYFTDKNPLYNRTAYLLLLYSKWARQCQYLFPIAIYTLSLENRPRDITIAYVTPIRFRFAISIIAD